MENSSANSSFNSGYNSGNNTPRKKKKIIGRPDHYNSKTELYKKENMAPKITSQ